MSNISKKELVEYLMARKKKITDASVTTAVTVKAEGKEEVSVKKETANLQVIADEEPTKLWLEYGLTKNLGNYESAKISIGISIPVGAEKIPDFSERVTETKNRAASLLESLVGNELESLEKIIAQRSGSSSVF